MLLSFIIVAALIIVPVDKVHERGTACRIPAFVELQRKICRHYDAILATLESGLSNARIKAVNNKIKLSIRMAYGFRNLQNMIDMT